MPNGNVEMRPVSELLLSCTLRVRYDQPHTAASDNCKAKATTVVVDENGNQLPRCPDHKGQVRPGVTGKVSETMPYHPH